MKILTTIIILLICSLQSMSQAIPVEGMVGNRYAYYQHGISRQLNQSSRFGWAHVASALIRYEKQRAGSGEPTENLPNELMSQFYLTAKLFRGASLQLGTFYSKATDFKGSAALQLTKQGEQWFFLVKPRVNISDFNGFEFFGLMEYKPVLYQDVRLYSKIQIMTSRSREAHQRSYQQVRIGVDRNKVQYGLAITLDEYGPVPKVLTNLGLFVRTELY